MPRFTKGGHVRTLGGKTKYRLISVKVDGKRKQVLEHRLVMERHLGRKLLTSEIVRHKDGDGLNNFIENLEIMHQSDHQREHLMTGPHKWPLDEAIELHSKGWTLAALGEKYGVAWTAIRAALKRRGINTKNHRHGTNSWDVESAKRMFDQGMTIRSIASNAGVAAPSVRKAFVKRGWLPAPVPRKTKQE
jgi:hypothetical protein